MSRKAVLSVAIALLAVAVPTIAVFVLFGPSQKVQANSVTDVLVLVGTMLFSFLGGLLATFYLKESSQTLADIITEALRARQSEKGPVRAAA